MARASGPAGGRAQWELAVRDRCRPLHGGGHGGLRQWPVELAGIVCDSVQADMRVHADGATGFAKVRFTSATEVTGGVTISVNAVVDAGEPGTSQEKMTGAKE